MSHSVEGGADAAARVARWVRPQVRALSAYHVPPPADLIKLDAMENPYVWPPDLVAQWLERLRGVAVNRYPDPAAGDLKARLRAVFGIPQDTELLLGNGSDEIIQMIALALGGAGRVILAPEPSFVMYRMIALTSGLDYVGVPLGADFSLDTAAMIAAIRRHQPAVVFLAYPNNPTGNLFEADAVRSIVEESPGLVVLDEAYHPYAGASFQGELGRYANLVVMRTLSKLGLAGLRLGLLMGPPAWLQEFEKTRLPYNINVLTQVSAELALAHAAVFDAQTAAIRAAREVLLRRMSVLPGLTVYPSAANFLLFRVPPRRATPVFEGLKRAGVLIKNLHGSHPALADCLRVTVGRPQENEAFLAGLARCL